VLKRQKLGVVIGGIVFTGVLFVGLIEGGAIPRYAEICEKNDETGKKECATHHISRVAVSVVGKFLERNDGAITAVSTIIIAVFTWRLWWSTDKLWGEAKRTSAIAESALIIPQRAYLCAVRYKPEAVSDPNGIIEWRFTVDVENTGNTPAIDANGGIFLQEILRDGLQELGASRTIDDFPANLVIGPRSVFSCGGAHRKGVLTIEQAKRIAADEIHIFLRGLVSYRDIFPNTPIHETEFCVRLSVEDATFKRPNPFGYNAHHKYNRVT
jgi:hypothetical protein